MTRSLGIVSLSAAVLILWATPGRADSVRPSNDAFVDTATPGQNNGGSGQLFVRRSAATGDQQTFLKFDLSTLPPGAIIEQATLRLFVNTADYQGDASIAIHEVLADWTEETLTAGTAPPVNPSPFALVAITAAPQDYVTVSIPANTVQGWLTTGNFGLLLFPTAAEFTVAFDSKENVETSHPPELELVLAPDIAPGSIGAAELARNAVSSPIVLDESLTGADIAGESLDGSKIAPGAIGQSELADDAVTSANVVDESLIAADIAHILISPGPQANTAIGYLALSNNLTGFRNTASGIAALSNNTTGSNNTATGGGALFNNTVGFRNTASGVDALLRNISGSENTAAGFEALLSNIGGGRNTAIGVSALRSNTAGTNNTATGVDALLRNTSGGLNTASGAGALLGNTTGNFNTATGVDALRSNNTGSFNTATGIRALSSNDSGGRNTATGVDALCSNNTGSNNTATGAEALHRNTAGFRNTATGAEALRSNSTGVGNTATGAGALFSNADGSRNTATGFEALRGNITGSANTATGAGALFGNSSGNLNTATGTGALRGNIAGGLNTAIGVDALHLNTTGSDNTAVGVNALRNNTTGSGNTAVGSHAGVSVRGSHNIYLNNPGGAESNTIRIGARGNQTRAFIAGIYGVPTGRVDKATVVIDSNGQLGTIRSSRRFKDEIRDMGEASSGLLRLRPVTFRYKQAFADGARPLDYGLVAEEVAEVYPDLVALGADGQVETVQYHKLIPMLLNELQKQHRLIEDLTARIARAEALHREATRFNALEE